MRGLPRRNETIFGRFAAGLGDISRYSKRALEQTVREIELAENQEAEVRPHAIILTERTVPSPIFVAAIIGVEKILRINLDLTQGPVSFVRQVLECLPEKVPAFGKPIGFVINYSPDQMVRFDRNGQLTPSRLL